MIITSLYLIIYSKIAPYSSVIINGIYWAPNSPKLIRIPDAKNLLKPANIPWIPTSPGCPPLPHRLGKFNFNLNFKLYISEIFF